MKWTLSIIVLLTCMLTMRAMNPMNPVKSYIITLTGDSINGMLDFRTPAMNARQCHFKADGQSSFTTYTPAEIAGYGTTEIVKK